MFRGEPVNISEGRPALHVALRMPRFRSLVVDGVDVVKDVHAELDRMSAFAGQVRAGEWVGATGRRIGAVVNIGIGGSDLGPAMAYEALEPYASRELAARFVSNVDPSDLASALDRSRAGRDALHRRLEDDVDARDDRERARCEGVGRRGARARRRPRPALRRRRRRRRSRRAHRHPAREHVSHLGLGRGQDVPLLGGRALAARHARRGALPRAPGGLPRDGRPFRDRGARWKPAGDLWLARGVVPQLHGRRDDRGRSLQPRTSPACPPISSSSGWSRTGSR